ncbi:TetR/AcrR family transcriptional regulator [Alicyclobacillus fastidiosus]|uniref:TetR/AcrR family transcriptional regulator n=1 Tax=Alicyclobacillus fastidiosus TaxID=392011 RepID=A0ABV5AE88_9BACL|nr:TetR/AcrR family transcriptional regulator [Alicyclobacillus fastidiosus]WEH09877.1 TetR/AcrR family transcriptional regulator [Alicyclobacillus fastidiosus]
MDLQQRVVEAAEQSFRQFGYKGTTMENVARIANVGKGTIYTFFASKEALLDHILSRLVAEMQAVANASIAPDDTFFNNLERALRSVLRFRGQHELLIKLAQEGKQLGTVAVIEGMARVEQAVTKYLRHHLEAGVSHGDVKPCNTELVAFIMLRTYTAILADWESRHEPLSDDELMQVFQVVFAEGLNRARPQVQS